MSLPPLVEPLAALTAAESVRTQRHAVLSGFGEPGQRRLAAAHVAVVGAGGLGAPVILALAAAGVGTLTVIDDDEVELANLQRQVIHRTGDVGRPKVDSAVRVAAGLSPETVVRAVRERLTEDNAATLLAGADVVIDGTDTFPARRAVASACEALGVPLVWGVLQEFHAQVTVFWSAPPDGVPALVLDDLYPSGTVGEVPSCAQVGVLGSLCLQVGGILATEAIKLLTGIGDPLLGRILVIDALRGRSSEVPLRAAPSSASSRSPHRKAPPVSVLPPAISQLTPAQTRDAHESGATLLDVREPFETDAGIIPGSVLVPLGYVLADPAAVSAHLEAGAPVVVVCKVGVRAQHAAAALRAVGVEADVLAGGIDAWDGETALP